MIYSQTPDNDPSNRPGYAAMLIDADRVLEDEILDVLASSKHPRIGLSQIAKSRNASTEVIEQIAKNLAISFLGKDLEQLEFDAVVREIAFIEESVDNPGYKSWKIQTIAKRCRRSYKELMECYNKALVYNNPVEPLSPGQFREKYSKGLEWFIPGWIPQGSLILLHGDGGTGKSLLGYEWIECALHGKSWNGFEVKQGSCLLVQSDEPGMVLSMRLDLMNVKDDDPLGILEDWTVEGMSRLQQYLDKNRPAFVLIDSLSAVNPNTVFSENETEYARPVLQLVKMCSTYDCSMVLIHHSNQNGRSRGTTAIHNSASEVWHLRAGDTPNERVLSVQKTRLGREPGSYKLEFDDESFTFNYLGNCQDTEGASTTQEEKIRLWLTQDDNRGIKFTSTEVAEYCGISKPAVRRALGELFSKGVLKKEHAGSGKRGYVYYSPIGANCKETLQAITDHPPRSHGDRIVIASPDRIENPDTASDTGGSDQAISKKPRSSGKKSAKNSDRLIASAQNPGIEPKGEAITEAIRGQTPDRMPKTAACKRNNVESFSVGDQVEILRSGMFVGKHAFVRGLDGGDVIVGNSDWAVEHRYKPREIRATGRTQLSLMQPQAQAQAQTD